MNVMMISTVGIIYDGITSVILSYVELLKKNDVNFYVISTIKEEKSIIEKFEDDGCKIIRLPSRKENTMSYFHSLIKVIRKYRIDVVHAHGNSATLSIELLAAKIGGCKRRISHSHNTKCSQKKIDKILRPLFYTLYTDAVACGEEAGKWLYGGRKFIVLKNGRDLSAFRFSEEKRVDVRKRLAIDEKTIVFGHVGGFVDQKNHEFLIRVYKEIIDMIPNALCFCIGDGELRHKIEEIVHGYGLSDRIIFTGNTDKVGDFLQAMDVMLLPSLFEGFPLVTIEWQASGLPCLLSDTITKECKIVDNVYYLSINENPKKWADLAINSLTDNRGVDSERACYLIRKAGFDINDNSIELLKLYK
jgi:glycosyltransferase involved in cell wall biosynthesis